jgi:hypothetical protein
MSEARPREDREFGRTQLLGGASGQKHRESNQPYPIPFFPLRGAGKSKTKGEVR